MRVWYICRANLGAGWGECGTLISSKCWGRLFEDPMASKRRWYCGCCCCRYKTKFGLLIEVISTGVACYVLADLPPQHMGDLKAAIVQQIMGNGVQTAEELFARLPDVKPASKRLRAHPPELEDGRVPHWSLQDHQPGPP